MAKADLKVELGDDYYKILRLHVTKISGKQDDRKHNLVDIKYIITHMWLRINDLYLNKQKGALGTQVVSFVHINVFS